MYEIQMSNGHYFWTQAQPTSLLAWPHKGLVQLGTAANVGIAPTHKDLINRARVRLQNGQVATTFLNPDFVSSIVDLDGTP